MSAAGCMLASPARSHRPGFSTVKKGIVAVVVLIVLLVLVAPGLIGHLAEKGINDNLEWVDSENAAFTISTSEFERSWFTSTGEHRIELHSGDLYYELLAAFAAAGATQLPVLVVRTRLDHGVIPVASLSRENGSLLPGLGSAVSTLSLEFADGSVEPLPVVIFSRLGLTGNLRSQFIVESSGVDTANERIDWGAAEILVTASGDQRSFGVTGEISSLAVKTQAETTLVGKLDLSFQLAATPYAYRVGPVQFALESFAVIGAEETLTAGPIRINSDAALDGDRINAELTMHIENAPVVLGGTGGLQLVARLEDADAAAFGAAKRSFEALQAAYGHDVAVALFERDLLNLIAAGMELHVDQLDIALPVGQVTSRLSATVAASDAADYTWVTALPLLVASADISLPAALVDLATRNNPDMHAAIGMGFLRKQGEFYVLEASFDAGVLTVNGAPMPLPLSGL